MIWGIMLMHDQVLKFHLNHLGYLLVAKKKDVYCFLPKIQPRFQKSYILHSIQIKNNVDILCLILTTLCILDYDCRLPVEVLLSLGYFTLNLRVNRQQIMTFSQIQKKHGSQNSSYLFSKERNMKKGIKNLLLMGNCDVINSVISLHFHQSEQKTPIPHCLIKQKSVSAAVANG